MNRPAGADFTKINELGIKVDTMEVTASFGASNVLDYKEHRRKGWRLFYTLFQMITAEDGCLPGHRCILIRSISKNKIMGCDGKVNVVCGKK